MKKYLVLVVLICSGCVGTQVKTPCEQPIAQPIASVCLGIPNNLIYEHITPWAVVAAKRSKTSPTVSELPPAGIDLGWGDAVVEMMKTPGWPALMDNAPEVGWSMAGVISAWTGSMYGIIPGLVGIPVRSFEKIMRANYDMQKEIAKLDDQLAQASIISGNQVEVIRAYLPTHSKAIKIKDGTMEIRATGKEMTEDAKELEEVKP